ncbi:SMI1/KNR4 family protein [Paenibacillus sp. OK003]|uniref:SMI1/KNR4 family protein n=1 Tax=Paenibacillus TaxID=44249 RepID=UPI0008C77FB6|nr:SMI1/KNR4 family protein [Paenibacillus sp. OK003]SEL31803.1 SMI1-KNR4 cell-wall [Paenibacillus sp. OK003]
MNEDDLFQPLNIELLVDMVKKISNSKSEIYHMGAIVDYFFKMNPPAQSSDIALIESECELILPCEYKSFLTLVNGLQFGNLECEICSVESVIDYYFAFVDFYPSNMLVIATAAGTSIHILLQINDNGYKVYATSAIGEDYIWLLSDDDLLSFFDKFISTYGFPYWKMYKDENTAVKKLHVD